MTVRQVNRPKPSINFIDFLASSGAAVAAGAATFNFVSPSIDASVGIGLCVYLGSIPLAYYRRCHLTWRAYFADKIPSRVRDAEHQAAVLRRKIKHQPVHYAVVDRDRPEGFNDAGGNVVTFPRAIRDSFPDVAERLLIDGSAVSRRGLAGVLSRTQAEQLQQQLDDMDMLELSGKSYYLNGAGRSFFMPYLVCQDVSGDGMGGNLDRCPPECENDVARAGE